MRNRIGKKERYRIMHSKTPVFCTLVLLVWIVFVPLTDYSFYQKSALELTGGDFIKLLNCGGGMFLGFSLNFVLAAAVCTALGIHSCLANKTILYEKMNGLSVVQSAIGRFGPAAIIVVGEVAVIF